MSKIRNARRVIRDAFAKDPDFRHSYQANIAMTIYDHLEFKPAYLDKCNETADRIIKLIFESGFDKDNKPAKPTQKFLDSLLFETEERAQLMLDSEYPGYTLEEKADGLYIMYTPEHVEYTEVEKFDPKPVENGKFEGYDHALKDLVE